MQHEFEFTQELSPIAKRFRLFHAANPDVYSSLVSLARQFREKNKERKIGIKMLYEVLRWNYYLTTDTDEEYRLTNDFTAPYARLIMDQEPDLAGAFQIKRSEVDIKC